MTRRFPEPELRQLYEWWSKGEISLRQAAKLLGCEPRTVMLRWERLDAGIAAKVRYRRAAHAAAERRYRQSLKANPGILPRCCGQINAMDAGKGVLYNERASEAFAAPSPALTADRYCGATDG